MDQYEILESAPAPSPRPPAGEETPLLFLLFSYYIRQTPSPVTKSQLFSVYDILIQAREYEAGKQEIDNFLRR